MAKTQNEHLLDIKDRYRAMGQPWPASPREIIKWGLKTGHIDARPAAIENYYSDRMAQAMREEYFTDERGKRVRALHPAHYGQQTLWDDIRGAPSEERTKHFAVSFQARRKQIVDDCHQLKIDVDYFNEHHKPQQIIQLLLDFTDDVAELEALDGPAERAA